MNRTSAIGMGAVFGGILAPFIGCVVIAITRGLMDPKFRFVALSWPIFFFPYAALLFGIPGGLAGACFGWCLHSALHKFRSPRILLFFAAMTGGAAGAVIMTIFKLASDNFSSAFFVPAVVSGSVAAALYSLWLRRCTAHSQSVAQ